MELHGVVSAQTRVHMHGRRRTTLMSDLVPAGRRRGGERLIHTGEFIYILILPLVGVAALWPAS